MKRILVIDESSAVRETLALILGREFTVIQRSPEKGALGINDNIEGVELLILGITPAIGGPSGLLRVAARAPYAILFLVDSRSGLHGFQDRDNVGCLAKPFNPYELKEKVGELLTRRASLARRAQPQPPTIGPEPLRLLEFPYVTRTAAVLIQRFAATRLPILISGELGCGQEQVARGIHRLDRYGGTWLSLNAEQINAESLAKLSGELSSLPIDLAVTFVVENLERVEPSEYSALANFVENEQNKGANWRLIATSQTRLLEKVYRGEFPDSLYYKFATLTLSLPPLRERQEDVPALATWFAQFYANRLALRDVSFSPAAIERLRNYLWFGNVSEMETVIARTLAVRKKHFIDESDLIFDFSAEPEAADLSGFEEFVPPTPQQTDEARGGSGTPAAPKGASNAFGARNGKSADLRVLIHELAHELKNPMVTIKTFAQLLGERYQDETFRARFQDVVDGDIERMDDLLEIMIEFADFSPPRSSRLLLEDRLRSTLEEVRDEFDKKQASIRWKGNGNSYEILADQAHLQYVLKNVLLAVFSQAKIGGEIEIDFEKQGVVAISYVREGARIMPITHYLTEASGEAPIEVLPLRLLLAKQLLERNGGRMLIEHDERDIVKMEFALA